MKSESEMNSCAICGSSATSACGGCKSIHYCSQAHQKQDWKTHKETCTTFKTTIDLETGKEHLIASRSLKPGALVLEETAAFYSPLWFLPLQYEGQVKLDEDLDPLCVTCGKLIKMLQRKGDPSVNGGSEYNSCSTCTWPVCSKNCEFNSLHADNECKLFTEQKMTYPPSDIKEWNGSTRIPSLRKLTYTVAMLRGMGVKKQNPQLFRKILGMLQDSSLTDRIMKNYCMSAMDHVLLLKCLIHDKEFHNTSFTELMELPLEDEVEYIKVYRVIQVNQFIVTKIHFMWGDPYPKSTMYIYPKASHISHSCVPNCSWTIGPPPEYKLRIRPAVHIKKGERLTVSRFILLGNHCASTSHRQAALTERAIFCKCDRCKDPSELGLYYSAIECPSCRKNNTISKSDNLGYLLPLSPLLGKKSSWKCNNGNCSYNIKATDYQKMIDEIELRSKEETWREILGVNQLGGGKPLSKDLAYWDTMGNAAERLGEKFGLHPNHTMTYTSIKNSVANACDADSLDNASPEILQRRLRRLCYCLAIEDKISPGLSFERVRLTTIIVMLLARLLISIPWVQLNTPTQVHYYHKLFKQCCAESLKYFKNEFHAPGKQTNEHSEAAKIIRIMTTLENLQLPWLQSLQ